MSRAFYQKINWGHYHRDTAHLRTAAEHGAYLLLIGALFTAGGKMAADDVTLARHACCTAKEWAKLKPIILPFFKIVRGKLTHKRVSNDLATISAEVGARKQAGRAGGLASAAKRRENRQADVEQTSSKRAANPTKTQTQTDTSEDRASEVARAPKARPTRRCPPDWMPDLADVVVGADLGLQPADLIAELAKFKDHEFTSARSDWAATYRNWIRRAAERAPRHDRNLFDHDAKYAARNDNLANALAGADAASRRAGPT